MDEVAGKGHSRFRLFGIWKRYRARQDQKFIEELASPGIKISLLRGKRYASSQRNRKWTASRVVAVDLGHRETFTELAGRHKVPAKHGLSAKRRNSQPVGC